MTTAVLPAALGLTMLLLFSAFFSASETALSSITKIQLRQIKKGKKKADTLLYKIISNPSRMLTTLLIGNNIVNIWASSIGTAFAIAVFGDEGVGIATGAMTILILVFSEITPKTIAAHKPLHFAHTIAPFISIAQKILLPLVVLFSVINSLFIAVLKNISPDTAHRLTEDELKSMMDLGKNEGVLEEGEYGLLNRAFAFTDLKLREIMTPRTAIAAIDINASFEEIHTSFREHRFSRMPVYENFIDSIQGMIHYKDILFFLETGRQCTLQNLIRPVLFVPESQSTFELLKQLEHSNQNMAIIIDEHGGTAGLVTIDDALAAVFGGIQDEYDTDQTEPLDRVQVIDSTHLRVPGNLKLTDLNALLKTDLDSEFYETIGGFVMELAEQLPSRGDTIKYGHMLFRIEELSNRQIQLLEIILNGE